MLLPPSLLPPSLLPPSLLPPSAVTPLPQALCTAFGRDTEGAAWSVNFLLEKILNNLTRQTGEAGVLEDTVRLLVSL